MIDFTPLLRALLVAAIVGTAIYLVMVGRQTASAWVWASACVVVGGLLGMLMSGSAYPFDRWSPPSAAGPVAGALCAVAIAMADRTKKLPRWLGIGSSIVGFYFASMLLRLALALVLRTE